MPLDEVKQHIAASVLKAPWGRLVIETV
jgi:hypothetical protein